MTETALAVLACGNPPIADDAVEALVADGRRAVIVPAVATMQRPRRCELPSPVRLWQVARSAGTSTPGPLGPWPLTSCVAVPLDLLERIGGPDPRYRTPIGWADLVIRLRHVEPSLPVVDSAVAAPAPSQSPSTWRADGHRYAANRAEAGWRLVARLLRSTGRSEDPGVRQLRPRD